MKVVNVSPLWQQMLSRTLWVVWIIYPKDKFIKKKISHFLLCWCYNLLISWWMNQDLDGKFCRKNADILAVFRRRRRRRSGRLKSWRNNVRGRPWPSPSSTAPRTSWSWSGGRERRTSKSELRELRGEINLSPETHNYVSFIENEIINLIIKTSDYWTNEGTY